MPERTFWEVWAQYLHRWGFEEPVASFLEASGPLSALFAQFFYLGQPLIGDGAFGKQWEAMARLLDDPDAGRSFATFLRKEKYE